MAEWTRLRVVAVCGFCSAKVPAETPILALSVRPSYRCVSCAFRYFGDIPPEDLAPLEPLPARPIYQPSPPTFVPVGSVARTATVLPFDARMAQAGEREPGSDDE